MKPVKAIGLLGCGTVGSGVVRVLAEQRSAIASRANCSFQVKRIVVRDKNRPRSCDLPPSVFTTRVADVLEDPEIELVVELIGGIEPAKTWIQAALARGKDVVTANKALLADCGRELFPEARQQGRTIACEAAIAGGIPVVATLRQSLTANRISAIRGILNGTSNFVIAQLDEDDGDLNAAIRQAQALGYAEADPTLDLDGTDAAQKLALLAQLAFGLDVDWRCIPRTSVHDVLPADCRLARHLGYVLRPLAVADRSQGDAVDCFVQPALVPESSLLAGTTGPENAVLIRGDAVGWLLLRGLGAGQLPTASAVVADLVDIALGRTRRADASWPFWPPDLVTWRPAPQPLARRWFIRQDSDTATLRDDLTVAAIEADEVKERIGAGGSRWAAAVTSPCAGDRIARLRSAAARSSRQIGVFPVIDDRNGL